MDSKKITSRNVSSLTTYEIRQELVRRGALDLQEDNINHNSMLRRLIEELVKEESKEAEARTQAKLEDAERAREAAKQDRERKKQEMLERSKARQQDPTYFQRIQELNTKVEPVTAAADTSEAVVTETKDEENDDDNQDASDPFRSNSLKRRTKIFVR